MQTALSVASPTVAIDWKHWETDQKEPNWIEAEAQRIITRSGNKPVNLLAKSIGTAVAMTVLAKKPELVNKIVLCGIPLSDLQPEDLEIYRPLETFPANRITVFQNDTDPHGSFQLVNRFICDINPNIGIIKMERSDHEYPFSKQFERFLS